MNMKNLEPAKIPAKVPASDLFSSNQGKQLFNKVWQQNQPSVLYFNYKGTFNEFIFTFICYGLFNMLSS